MYKETLNLHEKTNEGKTKMRVNSQYKGSLPKMTYKLRLTTSKQDIKDL